uniref:Coiled-coil domain containing 62 n=1 Tax=Cyprinodon variegatus TaxID=28743 RepID=A0A3Q2FKZ6_CYPVA
PVKKVTAFIYAWKVYKFLNLFFSMKLPVKDLSVSTLQRQRKELQLLMAELKDRERELNAMSASHHKQHQAWEQDRHTMVMLERRCAGLEEELQSRNEVIRVLTKHVGVVESREKVMEKELGEAKQLICELEKKQQHINEKCQDYELIPSSLHPVCLVLMFVKAEGEEEKLSLWLEIKACFILFIFLTETCCSSSFTGEGESWKDELLELSRSKQERIMSELLCLQQVCENQRKDLQLLRLNQGSTQRQEVHVEICRLDQGFQQMHVHKLHLIFNTQL